MSKKVVLDNCVMAWAFKSQLTESHDAKTIQAQRLIEKIDKEGDELVIPSVVLFEFLSIFDKDERDQRESFLRELLSSIKICNYGYECAKNSASLFVLNRGDHQDTGIDESNRTSSQRKTDIMILGQAKSHGVSVIYTGDTRFASMANRLKSNHGVEVTGMPEPEEYTIEDQGVKI